MIGKQGKHFTTAKIFKKVCKTLFVTVTILSPNFCLHQNHGRPRFMQNYGERSHDEGDISTPFLRLSVDVLLFKYLTHCYFARVTRRYVITSTLKRHRHYMANRTKVYCPLGTEQAIVYHRATSQSRLTWRVHFVSWTLQHFKTKRHKRSKRCMYIPEQFL